MNAGLSCGEPPSVADASFQAPSRLYEDVATYSCDPGFENPDSVDDWIVTCQSDGMWSEGTYCKREDFE